ncbi:MAG TPA: hypothetical protein VMD75_18375 [Candidatus Binataceae bacterium]|nr:hypothetical protein [Candidatus Binataceae bacterium]
MRLADLAQLPLYGVLETSINTCIDNDPGTCDPVMGAWPLRAFPCRIAPLAEPSHQVVSS